VAETQERRNYPFICRVTRVAESEHEGGKKEPMGNCCGKDSTKEPRSPAYLDATRAPTPPQSPGPNASYEERQAYFRQREVYQQQVLSMRDTPRHHRTGGGGESELGSRGLVVEGSPNASRGGRIQVADSNNSTGVTSPQQQQVSTTLERAGGSRVHANPGKRLSVDGGIDAWRHTNWSS